MTPNNTSITEWLQSTAQLLGFDGIGFTPIQSPPATIGYYDQWLANNYYGSMHYLQRGRNRRFNPRTILPGAQSFISVAMSYSIPIPPPHYRSDPTRGQIALYAHRRDYHDTMLPRLKELSRIMDQNFGTKSKAYVDTGSILERAIAVQAGIGFFGKNNCLIVPGQGSYFLLGEIITTANLASTSISDPNSENRCGACHLCLDRCPTQAFPSPHVLDARKCISYLSTLDKESIPVKLRPLMKNWIFKCDECQLCCPFNSAVQAANENFETDDRYSPLLLDLVEMSPTDFHDRFRDTPVELAGFEIILRNVAIALTNWGSSEAREALKLLSTDTSEMVADYARWGLQFLSNRQ